MFDAAFSALSSLANPSLLLMLAVGVLAGLVMGLIPGLGGTGAVTILIPITFGMEPEQAFALLIGALAVVHTSDTVSAVLLGAPGSASASVTMLDGYAMARKGEAKRALSLAFLSSMAGGLIGALGLTLSIPLARPLVLVRQPRALHADRAGCLAGGRAVARQCRQGPARRLPGSAARSCRNLADDRRGAIHLRQPLPG